jgi:M-phase inducer tyrosine phosphatase
LDLSSEMPFFTQPSTQYLNAPPAPSRHQRKQRFIRPLDDVDDFLSSDLELSFASNVSLHSPPRDPIVLAPDYAEPMDISPAPAPRPPVRDKDNNVRPLNRPRAYTSASRTFGRDMSNDASPGHLLPSFKTGSTHSSSKRTQRAALPTEWFTVTQAREATKQNENISAPPYPPSSPADDAMDVDSSYAIEPAAAVFSFPLVPHSAAPTVTGFDTLFYDTMSPRRSLDSPAEPQAKKRRSLSPEPVRLSEHEASSSPALPSSPSQRKLERMSSGPLLSRFSKPTLQGLGTPSLNALKRPRRPALSAMVHPSQVDAIQSAYPILASSGNSDQDSISKCLLPVRRAFSALISPTAQPPNQRRCASRYPHRAWRDLSRGWTSNLSALGDSGWFHRRSPNR